MFVCEKCGNKYEYLSSLVRHNKKCNDDRIMCKLCDIEFGYKYNLTAHNKNKHASEKIKVYPESCYSIQEIMNSSQ